MVYYQLLNLWSDEPGDGTAYYESPHLNVWGIPSLKERMTIYHWMNTSAHTVVVQRATSITIVFKMRSSSVAFQTLGQCQRQAVYDVVLKFLTYILKTSTAKI